MLPAPSFVELASLGTQGQSPPSLSVGGHPHVRPNPTMGQDRIQPCLSLPQSPIHPISSRSEIDVTLGGLQANSCKPKYLRGRNCAQWDPAECNREQWGLWQRLIVYSIWRHCDGN